MLIIVQLLASLLSIPTLCNNKEEGDLNFIYLYLNTLVTLELVMEAKDAFFFVFRLPVILSFFDGC